MPQKEIGDGRMPGIDGNRSSLWMQRIDGIRKMEEEMYSEKVMDHFKNPRNVGEIEDASGVGTVGNAKCGDIMRIFLDIDGNGIIQDVKFKTFGCGAAVATSSMATEPGRYGSIRRPSPCQGTLLPFGRGGHPCRPLGLCREEPYHD